MEKVRAVIESGLPEEFPQSASNTNDSTSHAENRTA
jgi:hypothetical protein